MSQGQGLDITVNSRHGPWASLSNEELFSLFPSLPCTYLQFEDRKEEKDPWKVADGKQAGGLVGCTDDVMYVTIVGHAPSVKRTIMRDGNGELSVLVMLYDNPSSECGDTLTKYVPLDKLLECNWSADEWNSGLTAEWFINMLNLVMHGTYHPLI